MTQYCLEQRSKLDGRWHVVFQSEAKSRRQFIKLNDLRGVVG